LRGDEGGWKISLSTWFDKLSTTVREGTINKIQKRGLGLVEKISDFT
jgi:hypothetical protein